MRTLLAALAAALVAAAALAEEQEIKLKPGLRLWTDDYSNLWQILQ